MTDPAFQIASLADHVNLVETISRWHWHEWGHRDASGSAEKWAEGLRGRTNRAQIPTTFIALDSTTNDVIGSVSIVHNDMNSHPELTPWLAGVFTHPNHRKRGVASALVRHAVEMAAKLGFARFYLHTETARDLYQSLGWQPMGEEFYEGELSTIMSIDTGVSS